MDLFSQIRKSKQEVITGLQLLPLHNHRDPRDTEECKGCETRKHFENAYKALPTEQAIKTFLESRNETQ